jgi:hypothetical protein
MGPSATGEPFYVVLCSDSVADLEDLCQSGRSLAGRAAVRGMDGVSKMYGRIDDLSRNRRGKTVQSGANRCKTEARSLRLHYQKRLKNGCRVSTAAGDAFSAN